MHGNVREWCQDKYHSSYKGAPSDGSAWESGISSSRVVRGGCFDDRRWECQSTYRHLYEDPDARFDALGSRVLRKL